MPHYVRLSIACILLLSTSFFLSTFMPNLNLYLRLYLLFFKTFCDYSFWIYFNISRHKVCLARLIMLGCLQPFFSYFPPSFVTIFMPTLKLQLWLYLLFCYSFCDISLWISFHVSSYMAFFACHIMIGFL